MLNERDCTDKEQQGQKCGETRGSGAWIWKTFVWLEEVEEEEELQTGLMSRWIRKDDCAEGSLRSSLKRQWMNLWKLLLFVCMEWKMRWFSKCCIMWNTLWVWWTISSTIVPRMKIYLPTNRNGGKFWFFFFGPLLSPRAKDQSLLLF